MSKKQFKTILVTGDRKFRMSFKTMKTAIQTVAVDTWEQDPGYVLTGTNRDVHAKIVAACKELKYRVLQAPANFQMFSGNSAEQMANADLIQTFRPDAIIVFSKESNLKESSDSVLQHLFKLARGKNIPLKVVG